MDPWEGKDLDGMASAGVRLAVANEEKSMADWLG